MEQTDKCPHCKEEVNIKAVRCPHCQSKIFRWTFTNKFIAAGVSIITLMIMIRSAPSGDNSPTAPTPTPAPVVSKPVMQPNIKKITLTESQCLKLKDEFYSLIAQTPYNKTQLGKELLEQYSFDANIPVKKSNPNIHYVLPQSECGQNLDTALGVIIKGEKKDLGI